MKYTAKFGTCAVCRHRAVVVDIEIADGKFVCKECLTTLTNAYQKGLQRGLSVAMATKGVPQ